ncbi:MAG TPA: serine hydrolase, partial [Hyphomicrobiaceae bacterium]|nr:serine hydrolase [Hyphomicrobiaceae bacterium]
MPDGARGIVLLCLLAVLSAILPAFAAPASASGRYASMVIDANTGQVLHQHAADEPRYPASLTKMMTLYIVFELMEQGRLSPETRIRVSDEAARTSP